MAYRITFAVKLTFGRFATLAVSLRSAPTTWPQHGFLHKNKEKVIQEHWKSSGLDWKKESRLPAVEAWISGLTFAARLSRALIDGAPSSVRTGNAR